MDKSPILTATLILVIFGVFCIGIGGVEPTIDTIVESCNVTRNWVDFNFCVSRLRAVPGSALVNRQGHILMATDLAIVSGAIGWDTATRMARRESDLATRNALEACSYLYWLSMLALRRFHGYVVVWRWGPATSLDWLIEQAGIGCDAALKGANATISEMAEVNREFNQLFNMAEVI